MATCAAAICGLWCFLSAPNQGSDPNMSNVAIASRSIAINNWAKGHELTESWRASSELAGWTRGDGERVIETNGDPIFEGDTEGFEDLWQARS